MGELRQHHPNLRISKVKALQKGDLLVVGDSPQDHSVSKTGIFAQRARVDQAVGLYYRKENLTF